MFKYMTSMRFYTYTIYIYKYVGTATIIKYPLVLSIDGIVLKEIRHRTANLLDHVSYVMI